MAAAARTPAKKSPAKKSAAKKTASAKQAPAKKTAAKKTAAKKTAAKKSPAKKSPAKKSPSAKQAPAKKTAATKSPAKKSASAKQAPAKKTAAKKTAAAEQKTAPAKKTTSARKAPAEQKAAPAKKTTSATTTSPRSTNNQTPSNEKGIGSDVSASPPRAIDGHFELPAPRGTSKDGISYTKDFDVKFLRAQRDALETERARLLGQATSLEDEAHQLIEEGEMGDVQFDDEGGEGDTMVVERERDLALSAQARQTMADIDAALARIEAGTYGYSLRSGTPIPRERLEAIPWATELVQEKVGGIGRR